MSGEPTVVSAGDFVIASGDEILYFNSLEKDASYENFALVFLELGGDEVRKRGLAHVPAYSGRESGFSREEVRNLVDSFLGEFDKKRLAVLAAYVPWEKMDGDGDFFTHPLFNNMREFLRRKNINMRDRFVDGRGEYGLEGVPALPMRVWKKSVILHPDRMKVIPYGRGDHLISWEEDDVLVQFSQIDYSEVLAADSASRRVADSMKLKSAKQVTSPKRGVNSC